MRKKGTIRQVLALIRPYMAYLILSLVFAAVSVGLTLYVPILIGNAVDYVIGPQQVDFGAIRLLLTRILLLVLLTALAQWLMNLCNNKITYHVVTDLRIRAFAQLQNLPLRYIDSKQYGDMISRIITDVDQFSEGLLMGFSQFFTGFVTIAGTILFMLTVNVKITLVVVVITPVSLFVARFIARRTYSMFQMQSQARGRMTSLVEEMVGGQKVVKALAMKPRRSAGLARLIRSLKHAGRRQFSILLLPIRVRGLSMGWCMRR